VNSILPIKGSGIRRRNEMKYAVVRIKGKQYKVKEGEEFLADKLGQDLIPEVLLVADEEKVQIGKPVLSKAKVVLHITTPLQKGEKIHVRTFKAKARIRKHIGSRAVYTLLKVKSISA